MPEGMDLIKEYLEEVEKGLKLFEQKYGRRDIMTMLHDKIIPRNGKLGLRIKYYIHGRGCTFEYPKYDVNFDFGPGFRSDGVCWFTLSLYARCFPERFILYQDRDKLEEIFSNLVKDGLVAKQFPEQSSLYYLTDSGKTALAALEQAE